LCLTGIQSVFVGDLLDFAPVNLLHVSQCNIQHLFYIEVNRAKALRSTENPVRLAIG
jgi:hypothetical protein